MLSRKQNFSWLEMFCLFGCQVLLLFAFFQKLDSIEAMHKHEGIVRLFPPDDKSYKDSFMRYPSAPDNLEDWKKQKKILKKKYQFPKRVR